jgi:hypothetical protein
MPMADASTTELLRKERRWFIEHPLRKFRNKDDTPILLAAQRIRGFCATMTVK